jgi:adenylate cyclase
VLRQFLASSARSRTLLRVIWISIAFGAAVGFVVTGGTTRGLLQGALSGVLIALLVHIVSAVVAGMGIGRLPFGASVAVSALFTAAAICAGLLVASVPWLLTEGFGSWQTYVIPFVSAVAASIAFTWWFALDRLLGGGVLAGLLTGRYHRPRHEERVFLFADLQRSTQIAERLGELRYHAFLNAVFVESARPVQEHGGLVYQYVGDQMVVTWLLEPGLAECVRCAEAIKGVLREGSDRFERDFGETPRFRFAIHCGPVVAGELGGLRREIVFSGDTLNTTARIEGVAKEVGEVFVVSDDVLRRATLPIDVTAVSLGIHKLAGKERPVELYALHLAGGGRGRLRRRKRGTQTPSEPHPSQGR